MLNKKVSKGGVIVFDEGNLNVKKSGETKALKEFYNIKIKFLYKIPKKRIPTRCLCSQKKIAMLKKKMIKWEKNLFPINRSLISEGNRETIKYFRKINPEFKILKFKSRTKSFDWIIPDEWIIKSVIKHESGKKFAEFKNQIYM